MTTTKPTRTENLISVEHVDKSFATDTGRGSDIDMLTVLSDVSLTVGEGEIVALLGRSGSGKSTLLRCIAGLIAPTSGTVRFRGTELNGANPGAAMVFQSFALLPWLTVLQNVELGLEARGVSAAERRERSLRAIDLIGLDGFESAYPKELSGGMRQRVGFARALVVEPDILLMDEPFSALDVLTSENLRGELLRLWNEGDFPTSSALIVTHNIEEAIQLADRVLVLASNPGRIKAELAVTLPHPRDRRSTEFEALVDTVYGILTDRTRESPSVSTDPGSTDPGSIDPGSMDPGSTGPETEIGNSGTVRTERTELDTPLPPASTGDLLPLVDAAHLLKLATPENGGLHLTEQGRRYAAADILRAKEQFATLAVERAPLVRRIVRLLRHSENAAVRADRVREILRQAYNERDAQTQLDTAIDWGRYGELFEYDADSDRLLLPQQQTGPGKSGHAA